MFLTQQVPCHEQEEQSPCLSSAKLLVPLEPSLHTGNLCQEAPQDCEVWDSSHGSQARLGFLWRPVLTGTSCKAATGRASSAWGRGGAGRTAEAPQS